MDTVFNPILEVHNLNKSYKDFSLQNVSFSLPEGCITGFIGANGAGKTTTINTILGLAGMDSGSVRFFGMDICRQEQEIKDRIGVVMDGNYFYENLTLTQMKNVIAPAYSHWCEDDFQKHLAAFSLNPKQVIRTLSKGMRAKYALALALSHKAELLIMDEPTGGLDPLVRSQVLDTLADYMNSGGKGVFFSTHITSDLDKIADVLVLIDHGSILFEEEKDILLDSHRMVKGSARWLTEKARPLFSSITETDFGFTGLTGQPDQVRALMPDAVMERPLIEDIMLDAIGKNAPAAKRCKTAAATGPHDTF